MRKDMTITIPNQIIADAFARFGRHHQDNMACEEACELTVAINHERRGRANEVQTCREAADCIVTALQVITSRGLDPQEFINESLVRLGKRIREV